MDKTFMKETIRYKGNNPMGFEPVGGLIAKFALPSVAANLVNAIYNIVDQIFIGKGVGYLGNAATTIAFPIITIILALSTIIGAGGAAYASIKLGERDDEQARKALCNAFIFGSTAGILLMVFGLLFLEPIVIAFGAQHDTLAYAKDYTTYILIAAPFNILGIILANFSRTDGNPRISMYSMFAGTILNIILDPLFIFVFRWQVVGAALATAISQIVSASILIWYFVRKGNMRFERRYMKPNFPILRKMIVFGVSSGVLHAANTVLNIILNNVLVEYGNMEAVGGDMALSAMGIVMKISAIMISICVGIGIGSQPIMGFNKGANQPERVRKTYLITACSGFAVTLVGWIICQTMPHIVLSLFEKKNVMFMEFAVKCMRIFLGGVFFAGLQIVTTNYLQATGQPLKANIMSLLRQVILLIPLIVILPKFMGLDGVLYAGMISDFIAGIIVTGLFFMEMKRLGKEVKSLQ